MIQIYSLGVVPDFCTWYEMYRTIYYSHEESQLPKLFGDFEWTEINATLNKDYDTYVVHSGIVISNLRPREDGDNNAYTKECDVLLDPTRDVTILDLFRLTESTC